MGVEVGEWDARGSCEARKECGGSLIASRRDELGRGVRERRMTHRGFVGFLVVVGNPNLTH